MLPRFHRVGVIPCSGGKSVDNPVGKPKIQRQIGLAQLNAYFVSVAAFSCRFNSFA
jgi:hypothetical protein